MPPLAGSIQAESVQPILPFGDGELGERHVFGLFLRVELIEGVLADGVVAHPGIDGIGRNIEPSAGIKRVTTGATRVGEDVPFPLRDNGAPKVIVQVATFGQRVEKSIELLGGGGLPNGIITSSEIAGWEQRREGN